MLKIKILLGNKLKKQQKINWYRLENYTQLYVLDFRRNKSYRKEQESKWT